MRERIQEISSEKPYQRETKYFLSDSKVGGEFLLLLGEGSKVEGSGPVCDKHQGCADFDHSRKRKQR